MGRERAVSWTGIKRLHTLTRSNDSVWSRARCVRRHAGAESVVDSGAADPATIRNFESRSGRPTRVPLSQARGFHPV